MDEETYREMMRQRAELDRATTRRLLTSYALAVAATVLIVWFALTAGAGGL